MPGLALWKGFLNSALWIPGDLCTQNPIPLPNGMGIFKPISNDKLVHIPTGNRVQVRSDYACWCCALNKFVPKSEVGVDDLGFAEIFRGVF